MDCDPQSIHLHKKCAKQGGFIVLLPTSDVKINKISEKNNTGVFEFSPLPAGFGRTLGSSLRRILLTSLKGSAVTEIRVPKVTHQFSTIPGVKEDLVEITLNVKNITAKMHTDSIIIGSIDKKGKGPVTSGDIEVSSDVEIIDKKVHIAELSDSKSKLEMDLTFEKGVGYSPVEERKTSKVGVILVDALFSPIIRVLYEVTPTRKGEETGLDKLTITVETDGSITPEDAVTEAATILRNFYSRFARGVDPEELETDAEDDMQSTAVKEDVFLEDLALPTRTINALKKHGVSTLQELGKLSNEELSDIKNLGDKSIKEIHKVLKKEGLK